MSCRRSMRCPSGILGNEDWFLGPHFRAGVLRPVFEKDTEILSLGEQDKAIFLRECFELFAGVLRLTEAEVSTWVTLWSWLPSVSSLFFQCGVCYASPVQVRTDSLCVGGPQYPPTSHSSSDRLGGRSLPECSPAAPACVDKAAVVNGARQPAATEVYLLCGAGGLNTFLNFD